MSAKYPLVSVIMPVSYEPIEYLKYSIESILRQTFTDFEFIIIIDTGESNEYFSQIYNFINLYKTKDRRVRIIINKKNMGLAYSLNRAMDEARGKYIARMDADDISLLNRLEEQVLYLEKNTYIDLLFCEYYLIDEKNVIIGSYSKKKWKNEEELIKIIIKQNIFPHPTLLGKSSLLKNFKYNENLCRAQDYELWLRLIGKGYNLDILGKKLYYWRNPLNSFIKKTYIYPIYRMKALWYNKKYYWKYYGYWFSLGKTVLKYILLKTAPKDILIKILKYMFYKKINDYD